MKSLRFLFAVAIAAVVIAFASPARSFSYVHSCKPVWSADRLPVVYHLNEDGTPDLPTSQVETIVADSFAAWQRPCCSDFSAQYAGQTDATAGAPRDEPVLSWTDQWPSALGNSSRTIAVTQAEFDGGASDDCVFSKAAILYNNQGFSFSSDGAWGSVDLASVTTHEVGHLLGLGHTSHKTATMYALYQGTASTRTLHEDDIDGVCALYSSASGCDCADASDCDAGQLCTDGACVDEVDCTRHDECPTEQMCVQGTCAPDACDLPGDCPSGLACDGLRCRSTCPVCAPCESSADCDGAAFCAPLTDGTSMCMLSCGPDLECPGNTRCVGVQLEGERTFGACLNDDIPSDGVCPDGFECVPAPDTVSESACPGLGNSCNSSSPACAQETVCLSGWKEQPICTCQCSTDADCGPDATCEEAGNQRFCLPKGYSDPPCENADCPDGEVCVDGACTAWAITGVIDPSERPDAGQSDAGSETDSGGDTDFGADSGGWSRDRNHSKIERYDDEGCSSSGTSGGAPLSPAALVLAMLALGAWVQRRGKNGVG